MTTNPVLQTDLVGRFRRNMRQLRMSKDLSQRALAEKLKEQTGKASWKINKISKIERGTQPVAYRLDEIEAIAKALDVDVFELLRE